MLKTRLTWLNDANGADELCYDIFRKIPEQFPKDKVYAAVLGSCYGGEVEAIATEWGDRGEVWGFDVFEDLHPTHLAVGPDSNEARCMDAWYVHPDEDKYGREKLALEYQQQALNDIGLDNAHLVKGEVHKDSCKDIPELHYALLDMDMIVSMKNGYDAVKDKFVKGGYLAIHDIVPDGHLEGFIYRWWYDEIMPKKQWKKVMEVEASHLGVYKRL